MTNCICVFNQKGGVGKTTTVVNLAAALGKNKKKVLVVDLDPQGNASSGFGIDKNSLEGSTYELVLGIKKLEETIRETEEKGVSIIASNQNLSGLEVELVSLEDREKRLKNSLKEALGFDYILIDCPPSLGQLSINALVCADSVLIPIQCEYYALEGVSQLVETIGLIKKSLNTKLEVKGVLLSMFDGRNNLSIEVVEEVKKYFKDKVFKTVIPRNIRLAEAPSFGKSVIAYDEKSKGAQAYMKLAKELIKRG